MATQKGPKHSLFTRPESTDFKHAASVSTLDVLVDQFGLGVEFGAGQTGSTPGLSQGGARPHDTPRPCGGSLRGPGSSAGP